MHRSCTRIIIFGRGGRLDETKSWLGSGNDSRQGPRPSTKPSGLHLRSCPGRWILDSPEHLRFQRANLPTATDTLTRVKKNTGSRAPGEKCLRGHGQVISIVRIMLDRLTREASSPRGTSHWLRRFQFSSRSAAFEFDTRLFLFPSLGEFLSKRILGNFRRSSNYLDSRQFFECLSTKRILNIPSVWFVKFYNYREFWNLRFSN